MSYVGLCEQLFAHLNGGDGEQLSDGLHGVLLGGGVGRQRHADQYVQPGQQQRTCKRLNVIFAGKNIKKLKKNFVYCIK